MLVRDAVDTFVTHASLVHDTTDRDTVAKNGSSQSQGPASFNNINLLTKSKRNQTKAAVGSVAYLSLFILYFILIHSALQCILGRVLL